MRRGAIVRVITIALLAAAAATAVAIFIDWLPAADSKEADRIDFVFWVVVAICIGVFAVVAAITVYSVVKFRVRPDDDSDGPPIHGHTGLEIVWTAIPTILVTVIALISAVALAENGDLKSNRLEVDVTAQQFAWTFKYPQYGGFQSNELRLVEGRQVQLSLRRSTSSTPSGSRSSGRSRTPCRGSSRTCRSRRPRPATTRSSAPSSAGSGMR